MIEKLKKVLKQEDTVLFIGSGVSLWSGLPSWSSLIQELIEFIKENGLDATLTDQELKRGDLLQAASYGFDKLTKSQFAQFVRKASRLGIAQPHEIHKKLTALGPTCYITTNYDRLLEMSFQKWKSNIYFRTVVNTQLTETAEIVGARANSFLFKLHGDAENSDSIILTREQYRALNPGGELNHALETARTLMLSRPIIYIGFGLRDPDFLYLKDLLINTYKGGARDHYAIMPDIGEQEKDYWRRNFGIHLISYQTIAKVDGKRDHSPILGLLDDLKTSETQISTPSLVLTSDFILSLNRHSAKYYSFETSKLHLPLVVHPIKTGKKEKHYFQFYEASIEKLLDTGPVKFILIGLPGAGKSYSFKASVARLSKKLSKECIEDFIKINETTIPIYVDLKLYEGDIIKLIEQNIPVGIELSTLCANFIVKLYLDAFNEIPKEFIESKSWHSDFSALSEKYNLSIVISSRTIDGLEEVDFPVFNIDAIDEDFVKASLVKIEIELKGIFRNEIITLLQKPFFYKLIFENKLKIESETSPQKIYSSLIDLINQRLNERFNININLLEPLSTVAMNALNNGEEAFKIDIILKDIELETKKKTGLNISSADIINWMVSQDFIVPLVNERISYFHQSVTEYLAATKLASLFIKDNHILKRKLSFRRWDQALFLCLSLLPKEEANVFLNTVIDIDFELALSAVKYLEADTTIIVERLLIEIKTKSLSDFEFQNQLGYGLKHLPITESHVDTLKQLIKKGDSFGGSVVGRLINLKRADFKDEAFMLLVDYCDDYNFCSEVGQSIKKYVTEDDVPNLLELCHLVQKKLNSGEIKDFDGFDSALGNMLEGVNPKLVYSTFFNKTLKLREQQVQVEVLCEYLTDCRNSDGLFICLELLSAGVDRVAFEIYMILHFSKEEDNIDCSLIKAKHIGYLISILTKNSNENSQWALTSLNDIFSKREDLISRAVKKTITSNGLVKAALNYAITNYEIVFKILESLLTMDVKTLKKQNFKLLRCFEELNWIGKEKLFVQLLKLRNVKLAYNLCDVLALRHDNEGLILEIGPINWWLEWFAEFVESNSNEWLFTHRVPTVITTYISRVQREEFVSEFNNPDSQYRKILSLIILRKIPDLKLDNFTEESLLYLLEEVKKVRIDHWNSSLLIDIATEQFVTDRMLPLLKKTRGVARKNLEIAIERIGKQHKRRYLI